MVQSGIAYAAGQLLAVVAPRTVLVVDAPTDWSLAGPLWELALDDAPVDEILDVLIRRGIRTAPSFAIVRVENDAVRALVRGSVPVCFERSGEPVRLDATGATTWLEGLISSAKRVLVGSIVSSTPLPFLVSTGVVLVSGLALPCGAEQSERPLSAPVISEGTEPAPSSASPAAPLDTPYFSRSAPSPVSAGSAVGVGAAAGSGGLIANREPRVVDLTRSGARTPAPVSSYAGTGESLNGHLPAVLEPAPDSPSSLLASPSRADEAAPGLASPSSPAVPSSAAVPAVASASAGTLAPPVAPSLPASYSGSSGSESSGSGSNGSGWSHGSSGRDESDFRFDPIDFSKVHADDPGELQDLDQPESAQAGLDELDDDDAAQAPFPAAAQADQIESAAPAASPVETPDPLDDLLLDPDESEPPAGPSPIDLPNFEPPVPSRGGLNGNGVPAQPRRFGSAASAWPPASWPPISEIDAADEHAADDHVPDDHAAADQAVDDHAGDDAVVVEDEPVSAAGHRDDAESPFLPPPASFADQQPPQLGELPLRVRGRSLHPEHNRPLNGNRLLGNPQPVEPQPVEPEPEPVGSSPSAGSKSDSDPASGSLLLPAFFRGARAARKPDADPATGSELPDDPDVGRVPSAWLPQGSGSGTPAPWSPPIRRVFPDRSTPERSNGFNGGPPAMPGVLRPAGADNPSPASGVDAYRDRYEEPTERTPGPSPVTPPRGAATGTVIGSSTGTLREPPRLLGVWCDAGHVTSPDEEECRVCGLVVPAQAPILVARPPLGVLIFDNGDRVLVDRPVVLGRDPKARPVSADSEAPVLHAVPSATGQVSRTHAEIRATGWDVVLTDLDAMNGTALTLPGASPVAIEPGVPTLITPGARVDLGGESGFVFEVEA